jgi:hypothetical protein
MHLATRFPRFFLPFLTILTLIPVVPVSAQQRSNASIGFFLQEASSPSLACRDIQPIGCSDQNAVVTGSLQKDYFAIACVFGGQPKDFNPQDYGISGVQFAIDYDGGSQSGVDIYSWNVCADGLDVPTDNWPAPRTGDIVTWIVDRETGDGCQENVPGTAEDGVTAIIGYFYLTAYSTDRLAVISDRRPDPHLAITTCPTGYTYELDPSEQAGNVGFSSDLTEKGNIPCVHHVDKKTWGQIKSTYGGR